SPAGESHVTPDGSSEPFVVVVEDTTSTPPPGCVAIRRAPASDAPAPAVPRNTCTCTCFDVTSPDCPGNGTSANAPAVTSRDHTNTHRRPAPPSHVPGAWNRNATCPDHPGAFSNDGDVENPTATATSPTAVPAGHEDTP